MDFAKVRDEDSHVTDSCHVTLYNHFSCLNIELLYVTLILSDIYYVLFPVSKAAPPALCVFLIFIL